MLADRYDLFIFDWDGTLATTTAIVRFARLLKPRYNVSRIERRSDSYKYETASELKAQQDMNRIYDFAYSLYSMLYRPRLKPGAIEMLMELKKKGKKIAVFSDSNRYRLLIETRKLGITRYVDLVLSADSIKMFKPNPAGLNAILKKFRVRRGRCVYIGDMAVDVFAARFAGIASCVVRDGVDPYKTLKSARPDHVAATLGDIMRLR
jgi:HAD superfamily hydrolase (TIGR01509 family)